LFDYLWVWLCVYWLPAYYAWRPWWRCIFIDNCYILCRMIKLGPEVSCNFSSLRQSESTCGTVSCVIVTSKLCLNQEFMSSACIEHLDFLDLSADVDHTFRTFQEKDKGKHYRSLTEIPKLVKMEMEEAWSNTNVIMSQFFIMPPPRRGGEGIKGTLRRRLTYIFFSFNKKFNI